MAGALVTAVSVALGILAFTYDGFTTTDVELNDGGVWVTKQESQQLGRINIQAEELDAGLTSPTASFDVLQDGDDVLLHNQEASAAILVDPVQVSLGSSVQLPPQGRIAMGGGVVAILDPADGMLWAMGFGDFSGFSPETEAIAELGEGAAVEVGRDGTVHAVSPRDGQQITIPLLDEGGFAEPVVRERGELREMQEPLVTAVGSEAVVLDRATSTLLLPGGAVEVPGDAAVQLVGDASDRVVLTTPNQLIHQPMGGGAAEVEQRQGGGDAVRPVQLGGCVYAVWTGSAQFVRDCEGQERSEQQVPEMDGSPATFRINRDAVVLNQYAEGSSWLLSDTLVLVDNWDDLLPEESEETSEEDDSESTEDLLTNQPPPLTDENTDPDANDDRFGARPGRSTVLPVLWNDSDADGDVLTARVVGDLPEGVAVSPVSNDSELQLQLPEGFSGGFTFNYEIADGRGGTDSAGVRVQASSDGENGVPEQLRAQAFAVEQGGEYEYQVLADWVDPDGDDMYLTGATTDSGDTIQTDPSGRLIYTATGDVGVQTLTVTVSDGRSETTGEVEVDVRERGDAPPLANADFVSTIEGREATIRPMLNDYSPSGRPLRLASVEPAEGVEMVWDSATGTVTVQSGPVGTHYLTYMIADGPLPSVGRIRIDIRTPDEEARPVAVRDTALLPQQGSALVDLLANDVDPAGGVLVVQQFSIESAAPITVELRDRRIVSIRDNGLDAPFQFTYTVSNGRYSETGTIEVIPVAPPAQPRAPKAVDDVATVRAGDYATIDVLANDFSPDGTPFEIVDEVVDTSFADASEGIAFVAEGQLRVHALVDAPTRATVAYEITDELGNRDSATVAVTIVPRDAEQNTPPAPETVTSRVLAGSTVRIPIPLDGIDPDGDGVELVGYDTGPEGGRILPEVGPDYFDFQAFPDSAGTVEFTYRVRDRWGAEGTATAIIGIAQAADVNQTPFAEVDLVTVRPDRSVAIAVLENDSDPDQDALTLRADGLELPAELADAEVNGERGTVDLRSPAEPGDYQFTYTVADARGASTTGSVVVTVAEDAPLLPPLARDDPLPRDGVELGVPLDVPVLENDLDPDGDPSELELSIVTGPGTVAGDTVQVVPSEEFQVVTYRVSDIDGLTSEAFVAVPPVRDRAPFLSRTEPVQIPSGILRELPLRDWVTTSNGNPPRITSGDTVTAVNDDDTGLIADTETLQFRSPQGYVGPASITFEVTDGSGPEDGTTAMLTIPIDVTPSSVVAPVFAGAVLRPVAGEGATQFDLRDATTDPDPGDLESMSYELTGGSMSGVDVTLADSIVTATAEVNTPPGATGSFQIVAVDRHGNRAPGTVVVEVVPTNRPMPIARDNTGEAIQGEPFTLDVVADDFNPFARDGLPLRMISAEVVSGQGDIGFTESEVTVTPGADFSGVLTVRYTVQDATELAQRQVSGTLTLNVKGAPEAPPRPNVDAVGDSQVTLTWAPPASNGAPITGYVVQSADGSVSQECGSTTCVIDGLTNNVTYTFQVVAQNEVGDSDPSAASREARPDVRPEQPAPPQRQRGDTQVALSWEAPVNNGSPIQHYIVEISPPAPNGAVSQEVQGLNHTWTGLTNGKSYQFRVQAVNLAVEPSDFSAYSQPVTPAGPPMQVEGVRATPDRSIPGEVQVQVGWTAPNANGAPIEQYTVTPSNGAEPAVVTGTSANFRFPAEGENVTFTVTATNDAGTSTPSAASSPIRTFTAPDAPRGVSASDGNTDSVVTWTPGSTNGLRANEVRYEVQGGGAGTQSFGPGGTYTGMGNNGGPYTMQVRAVAVIDGTTYASGWTNAGNQARPYGAIGSPSASGSGQVEQVTFNWSAPGRNGRDISTRIRIGNGSWQNVGNSGSQTANARGGETVRITVETTTGASESGHGAQTTTATADATAEERLNPSITLSGGGAAYPGDCQGNNGETCQWYQLNWTDFETGVYSFTCHNTGSSNGAGNPFESGRVNITSRNGSTIAEYQGEAGDNNTCYSGFAGQAWMHVTGNGIDLTTPRVNWP
ncbi:Ig-like domain-containing protein [Agrococcus baldri]|uniref:Fibronectin type III n=1 Tax=Agrococcus baldri TaxID=153730 RepID=A0AA87RFW8_9MICO|nr:Ig-like domain-containing protein [Agrococcus baldri]GEK79781.1 fibronectin type III [Agrococcus baldri]